MATLLLLRISPDYYHHYHGYRLLTRMIISTITLDSPTPRVPRMLPLFQIKLLLLFIFLFISAFTVTVIISHFDLDGLAVFFD